MVDTVTWKDLGGKFFIFYFLFLLVVGKLIKLILRSQWRPTGPSTLASLQGRDGIYPPNMDCINFRK